ncbi:MAG: MFS transporter [Candidatus Puniceispirillaceae bacterium]
MIMNKKLQQKLGLTFLKSEWRFMLFGALMANWSSLGQTFFISLFSAEIRQTLDLSHGDFGTYYAIATAASALTLVWLGKLADTVPVRKLSFITLTCICLSALHFSTIQSVVTLTIGIYLLRLWGQGMMSHVWSTAMARRYVKARGRTLALASFGMTIAESIGPAIVVAMMAVMSWRLVWVVMPVIAFMSLAPFLGRLTERSPLQDGEGVEGMIKKAATGNKTSFNRRDMLRDSAFWLAIIWLVFVPSFTVTGLLFHQIYLAELKNVTLLTWAANYSFYAVAAIIGSIISGIMVDRFTAHKIVAMTQMPVILFAGLLWISDGPVTLALFFMMFGLCSGMPQTALSSLLAERYGTQHLGEIKAATLPINVLASAGAPILMGIMIDQGAGLTALMTLLAGCGCVSAIGAFCAFNLGMSPAPNRV